jgi:hypothetical protein
MSHKKTKKKIFQKNKFSQTQKVGIAKQIYDFSLEDTEIDFKKLVNLACTKHSLMCTTGNKVVNYFTGVERLNTRGSKHLSFYDVVANQHSICKRPYVNKTMKFNRERNKNMSRMKALFGVANIYFQTTASIFKPIIAMDIYCQFKPTSILDFTMGWGGRLVGACALNISNYIGIDSNLNLIKPYQKMVKFLKRHSTTKMRLLFKDALNVDYSRLTYDLVLTSPPYYNIETYGKTDSEHIKSKQEWNESFYVPIVQKTFKHLQRGGYYCLNVPVEIYKTAVLPTLGKPFKKIELRHAQRGQQQMYHEFIYVWKK